MINSTVFRRHFLLLLSIIGLSSFLISAPIFGQSLDRVVAVVNHQAITQTQLNNQLTIAQQQMRALHVALPAPEVLRQQVLNQLINKQLQLQAAKKMGFTVNNTQVNHAIAQIAARNGLTVTQLQSQLARQGMSVANYRKEIHDEILISQLQQQQIAPQITISSQEITDALRSLPAQSNNLSSRVNNPNAQYRLLDIVVPVGNNATAKDFANAKKMATLLRKQLQQGADIQSVIPKTAQINDLGWRNMAQLPSVFIAPISNLALKDFSAPIRADNGYHILQLIGEQNARHPLLPANLAVQQVKLNWLMIKKNPLMTQTQMQARLTFLRNEIIAIHDFASIAQKNSQDPVTANRGGSMGWVNPDELPPQVSAAISKLAINEISQPIETENNYYLVQVTERRHIQDLSTLRREQARQWVYQRKYNQALQQWLQTLRGQSYIKIFPSS